MFSVTSRTADELSRNYLRHRIETSKAREYRIEKTINLVFRAFLRSSWENSSQNSPEKNAISILATAIESVDISLCTCRNLTSVMVVELMAPKVSECAELRGTGHFPAKTTFAHAYTMVPTSGMDFSISNPVQDQWDAGSYRILKGFHQDTVRFSSISCLDL